MNKPSKCKNCQWYGKPYWSIINPCDSCPNENDYKTIITIDGEPLFKEVLTEEEINKAMTDKSIFEITLEEKDKEIERLNNIIDLVVKDMEMTKYNPELPTYNSCVAVDKDHIQQWIDKLKELKEDK